MATNKRLGWKRAPYDPRDFQYKVPPIHRIALPAAVDLATPAAGPPFDPALDQGNLGSCGPNSQAHDIAFREIRDRDELIAASRLFMYYATRMLQGTINSDSGVDNRSMLSALQKYGFCSELSWPYNIAQFRTRPPQSCWDEAQRRAGKIIYENVAQDLVTMKSCIASGYPFIFGFDWLASYDAGSVDTTGDLPVPKARDAVEGGHDVLIVGYDDAKQRFKFRNSWGNWGNNGNGTVPYSTATNPKLASDFYRVIQVDTPITPPAPPIPPTPPVPPIPPAPPEPGPIAGVPVELLADVAKGKYLLVPALASDADFYGAISPEKLAQIVALIESTLAAGNVTPLTVILLVMQIVAILKSPV